MTSKLLAAVALAGLIAGSTVSALAQSDAARPLSPSGGEGDASPSQQSLTRDAVEPNDPWGNLQIDMAAPVASDMDGAELAELRARCNVIVANPDRYDESYIAFCQTNASAMSQ